MEVSLKPSPLQAEQDQVTCMAQQEDKKQHIQVKRRVSYWIEGKIFSPWGQSPIGTGCPETLCSLHLGRFSRHSRIRGWKHGLISQLTKLWAGGWTGDLLSDLQTSATTWSNYYQQQEQYLMKMRSDNRKPSDHEGMKPKYQRVWNKWILLPGATQPYLMHLSSSWVLCNTIESIKVFWF